MTERPQTGGSEDDDAAGAPCVQLHAYVDDELSDGEREAFEDHLASCEACAVELPRLLALIDVVDGALAGQARSQATGARLTVLDGGLSARRAAEAAREAKAGAKIDDVAAAPAQMVRRSGRRSGQLAVGAAALVAIAAGVLVMIRPAPPAAPTQISLAGDLRPTRGLDARLSYPGTEPHRALDVARGDAQPEAISLERLAALEKAHDWHGLAVASLLAGERERALRAFAQAPAAPEVDSDRAALELSDGSPPALERALDDADRALAGQPQPELAAARWNRALVLAALGLPLVAARDFDAVAARSEPGWADEARTRAKALRADVARRRTRWQAVTAAGTALIADGTPVPTDLLGVTGYMTLMLYDAVRSAPSKSRVEALLPMAQALDAAYHSDHLTSYVHQIASADFVHRKPLADRYRAVFLSQPGADAGKLIADLEHAANPADNDIWLGAMVWARQIGDDLATYRTRALATGDPWFAVIAEHEAAKADLAAGKPVAAEHRLKDALALARRERLTYRALRVEDELIQVHRQLRDLGAANTDAIATFRDAASAGEVVLEMNALVDLSFISQPRGAGLARAYLGEQIERAQTTSESGPSPFDAGHDCATRRHAFVSLANMSLHQLEPARARAELAQAPSCISNDSTWIPGLLLEAMVRAELYRVSQVEADRKPADDALLAASRAELSEQQRVLVEYIAGEVMSDNGKHEDAQRAFAAVIAKVDHLTDNLGDDAKTRAYSFAALALDYGSTGDLSKVLGTLAQDLEMPVPERCALAIAVEDDRWVIAVTDDHGQVSGQYLPQRTQAFDPETAVRPELAARLRGCERVAVLARQPVLGAARLLPPDLAWSYALPGRRAEVIPGGKPLIVTNPEPPPELKLAPLAPYPDPGTGATVLRGSEATPSRVLAAMPDASVIELHTHGYIANDVVEASYLVLTPEPDRTYALTAGDLTNLALPHAPVVILGACHAATSSRSREGGIGLPEAFRRAGARAVLASPDVVQDAGAQAFFAAVRDRIARGVDPAIAVRDERERRLAAFKGSGDDAWLSGVVVFE